MSMPPGPAPSPTEAGKKPVPLITRVSPSVTVPDDDGVSSVERDGVMPALYAKAHAGFVAVQRVMSQSPRIPLDVTVTGGTVRVDWEGKGGRRVTWATQQAGVRTVAPGDA